MSIVRQDDMADDKPNAPRWWEKQAFVGSAAISYCLTIYLLVNDKTVSATVAGAFTIALLLFYFLPIVESFEVFGLKARLRHGISEANRLLSSRGLVKVALYPARLDEPDGNDHLVEKKRTTLRHRWSVAGCRDFR